MDEHPFSMKPGTRMAVLAGSGTGIVGGLAAFIAGQVLDRPYRLSLPGLLIVIGTMTLMAAIGLLRSRMYPVAVRKPSRRVDFRPRSEAPFRYWGLLAFCMVATLLFFVTAVRMFCGWVPEGTTWPSQPSAAPYR